MNPAEPELWRWKYRVGGKEKLVALGDYPDVSLAPSRFDIHSALAAAHQQFSDKKDAV